MNILLREKVDHDVDVADALHDLAERAESKLRYGRLKAVLPKAKPLAAALTKLGIEPYTEKSVRRYQFRRMMLEFLRATKRFQIFTAVCLAVAALGFSLGTYWGYLGATSMLCFCIATEWRASKFLSSWSRTPLSQLSEDVPEFALSHALAIVEECPRADFLIEGLYITDTRPAEIERARRESLVRAEQRRIARLARDPFLIVRLDNEEYYIDVWNEPEFECRKALRR